MVQQRKMIWENVGKKEAKAKLREAKQILSNVSQISHAATLMFVFYNSSCFAFTPSFTLSHRGNPTNQSELDLWKQDKPIPRNVAWLKKINKYQRFKYYQNMQAIFGHGSDYNLIQMILHTFSRERRRGFQSLSGSINLKKQLISCLLSTHT